MTVTINNFAVSSIRLLIKKKKLKITFRTNSNSSVTHICTTGYVPGKSPDLRTRVLECLHSSQIPFGKQEVLHVDFEE